jgi:CheY-like chemotaxis protein
MQTASSVQDDQLRQKCILVIEDDTSVGACLVEAITQETPWNAFLVTESQHALQVLEDVKPDLILLDYFLPQMNGLALYDYLHSHKPLTDIPVVMISANLPHEEIQRRHLIALEKPFELDDLLATIHTALLGEEAQ